MQLYTEFLFVNLGAMELTIIFVLVLILFGPGKLPSVMKSLGDGVRHFKNAAGGITANEPEKVSSKAEAAEKTE